MPKRCLRILGRTSTILACLGLWCAFGFDSNIQADDALAFFENRIRPVLVEYCYECHSEEADVVEGGLRVDSRAAIIQGGDSGSAVVVGDAEASLLWQAIAYQVLKRERRETKDLQMPPDGALPAAVVADFRKWIDDGVVDPRDNPTPPSSTDAFDLDSRRDEHWAWQPVCRDHRFSTIDAYIDEGLEEHQLQPADFADAVTLLRRMSFDLVGLPPSLKDLQEFEAAFQDDAELAVRNAVDRLLQDPGFGEHWGRHWLDVVRFSETKGHVTDQERPFAWKYRDYVIRALNDDLPFDQFIREHVAGDLLPPRLAAGTNQAPAATGALYMHEMHFMAVDPVRQRWDEINAQIDMVSKAFLGITVECARCHDHKFDAISQDDYYALAGFFQSTEQGKSRVAPRDATFQAQAAAAETAYDQYLANKIASRRKAQTPKVVEAYFPISEELGIQSPGDTQKLFQLMRAVEAVDPSWSSWVRSARDVTGQDAPFLIRGNPKRSKHTVTRRFLMALGGKPLPEEQRSASGRAWLAEQIASQENPLTARVYVNRVWHHLFGRGLVATPNNFGKLGEPPSHPELLDFLADGFQDNHHSTKSLIREIVLSKAYRRASRAPTEQDPQNIWLAHQNVRRLTAEQIRDAMLFVSGRLDKAMHGPSVDCFVPPYATANKPSTVPKSGPLDGAGRRSIYLKIRRNYYDPFLLSFDFPDPSRSVGRRDVTVVPSQSLAMLNSPLVHRLANYWGERIGSQFGAAASLKSASADQAFELIWRSSLGDRPSEAERRVLQRLVSYSSNPETAWQDIVHVVWNHPDFMWIP